VIKHLFIVMLLVITGCTTARQGVYRPKSGKEKAANDRADRGVSPADVRKDFHAFETNEVAWAGIIKDIQFKETQRSILVAFQIDHRDFDWKDHGGSTPYILSSKGDGAFKAGWTVRKPASIAKLNTLAKPGYMILVYGKPYQMKNGVIQLSATAVRPIKTSEFMLSEGTSAKDHSASE